MTYIVKNVDGKYLVRKDHVEGAIWSNAQHYARRFDDRNAAGLAAFDTRGNVWKLSRGIQDES